MPVETETFRELWAPLVHINFGGNSYGPIIGPYLFLEKFVWTNGPESSPKVSPYTGIGPVMAFRRELKLEAEVHLCVTTAVLECRAWTPPPLLFLALLGSRALSSSQRVPCVAWSVFLFFPKIREVRPTANQNGLNCPTPKLWLNRTQLGSYYFELRLGQELDIFETPCDRDPPIGKTLNSSTNALKVLNVYFWGDDVYFWGDNFHFWRNKVYSRGFSKILGFWEFLFVAGGRGGFGTLWVEQLRRGFRKEARQESQDWPTFAPQFWENSFFLHVCLTTPHWQTPLSTAAPEGCVTSIKQAKVSRVQRGEFWGSEGQLLERPLGGKFDAPPPSENMREVGSIEFLPQPLCRNVSGIVVA